jgi:hypothetical protein
VLPAHDTVLSGDSLTTVSLNRVWREFIVGAIEAYLANPKKDELTLDNQDLLSQFYNDVQD